jgi:hypothetical protein
VGFFWDRFNTHQCSYVTRTDRRVEGWLRRSGWVEGWAVVCEVWVDRWAEREGKGGVWV